VTEQSVSLRHITPCVGTLVLLASLASCGRAHRIRAVSTPHTAPVPVSSRQSAPSARNSASRRPRARLTLRIAPQASDALFSNPAGELRFRVLASDVCHAVREDAPSTTALVATIRSLRSYAERAVAPARRTSVSLRRLPAPPRLRVAVGKLIRAYQELALLYASAARLGSSAKVSTSVARLRNIEQRATRQAFATGLLGCAPRGAA
jgi:hypothetical protein